MEAGTKVKILMKNNLHFNGSVISDNELFLEINDRFGAKVNIAKTEISLLEVIP